MTNLLFSAYGTTWRAEYGEINEKPLFRFGYKGDVGWEFTATIDWLQGLIDILQAVQPLPVGQLTKGPIFQARKRQNLHQDVVVEPRSDTSYPTPYFDIYSEELADLISTLKDLASRIPDEEPEDWDGTDREKVVLEFQRMEDELSAVGEQLGLISTEVDQVSAEATRLDNVKVDKGDPSAVGPPGPKGDKGDKGDPGADGAAGPKGAKGDPGADGAVGPKGDPGADGARGATGPKGATGATGPKGDKGDTGARGATGAKGAKGDKGDPGDGVAPAAGRIVRSSSYETTFVNTWKSVTGFAEDFTVGGVGATSLALYTGGAGVFAITGEIVFNSSVDRMLAHILVGSSEVARTEPGNTTRAPALNIATIANVSGNESVAIEYYISAKATIKSAQLSIARVA